MTEITLQRETLLTPLQLVISVVERCQAMPILSNVLLTFEEQRLSVIATDLEVELQAHAHLGMATSAQHTQVTVSGRKLLSICRCLPEQATLRLELDAKNSQKLMLYSGQSRFSLATLPASDFPLIPDDSTASTFLINQKTLRSLLQRTHFAMGQQDVRYYLNGMLLEINDGMLRTVATDGHRLALNAVAAPDINDSMRQVILPRKGVLELIRLLESSDADITVYVSSHQMRVSTPNFTFISKLIDAHYPDYADLLPRGGDKTVLMQTSVLKQALQRAAILSNEKFFGIRLQLRPGLMKLSAQNTVPEEMEEEIPLEYPGPDLDIGFNVHYLLDVLDIVNESIKLTFAGSDISVLMQEPDTESVFLVMPMQL